MIGKRIYKENLNPKDYADTAVWCNQNNAHIEDKGEYYEVVENIPHVPTIQEQIVELENMITARNIREAFLGDEFALNRIATIEAQIAELRKKLL